jgi:hypothetical protein
MTRAREAAGRLAPAALLLAAILGPQAASEFFPGLHPWLIDHWALTWAAAWREPWRLVLSPLVQPRPGLVGTEWMFALAVVPACSWLWRWPALAAGFWGADAAGTLPTLGALRVAAAWSDHADRLLQHPDSGASAGLFGLAVVAAWRLPAGIGRAVLAGVALFAAGRLALFHRTFDVEHALAIAATSAVLWAAAGPPGSNRDRGAGA